jgi:hypothetical protein
MRRFETEKIRHSLWVQDLKRYGIQCVEVDEYREIDEIIHAVELRLAGRSTFVSGSLPPSAPDAERRRVEDIAREVGRVIAGRNKRLVSGFGLSVGSAVVSGALGVILQESTPNLERSLLLRPFPQEAPAGTDMVTFQARYRDGMIQQAGVCVFICGLKEESPGRPQIVADGVLAEYESAKRLKRVIVPIGASGGAAEVIWHRLNAAGDLPAGLTRKDFDDLNSDAKSASDLAKIVGKAIAALGASGPKSLKK